MPRKNARSVTRPGSTDRQPLRCALSGPRAPAAGASTSSANPANSRSSRRVPRRPTPLFHLALGARDYSPQLRRLSSETRSRGRGDSAASSGPHVRERRISGPHGDLGFPIVLGPGRTSSPARVRSGRWSSACTFWRNARQAAPHQASAARCKTVDISPLPVSRTLRARKVRPAKQRDTWPRLASRPHRRGRARTQTSAECVSLHTRVLGRPRTLRRLEIPATCS